MDQRSLGSDGRSSRHLWKFCFDEGNNDLLVEMTQSGYRSLIIKDPASLPFSNGRLRNDRQGLITSPGLKVEIYHQKLLKIRCQYDTAKAI